MSRRDPFTLALIEIRDHLRSGRLVQGEQLMITAFARRLGLSATPVREALSRLAGEGLIEDRRGAGYFAPRLDAVDLVDLYDLSWTYLDAALATATADRSSRIAVERSERSASATLDLAVRTEVLFDTVALRGRNAALRYSHRLLSHRLAAVRRAEPTVLVGIDREIADLEAAVAGGAPELIDHIRAYHERRRRAAADIVSALRTQAAARCGI